MVQAILGAMVARRLFEAWASVNHSLKLAPQRCKKLCLMHRAGHPVLMCWQGPEMTTDRAPAWLRHAGCRRLSGGNLSRCVVLAATVVGLGILAVPTVSRAEPDVAHGITTSADFALGAGALAGQWYAGTDLRLDTQWRSLQLGVGARFDAVDGRWRSADFAQRRDAVKLLRYARWTQRWDDGSLAIAAGNLAPLTLGAVASGYRPSLDLRRRVGAAARVVHGSTQVESWIDDVLAPSVVAGSLSLAVRAGWHARLAIAADVSVAGDNGIDSANGSTDSYGTVEVSLRRLGTIEHLQLQGGGGVVVEPGLGASAVVFGQAELRVRKLRLIGNADVRAGTGTVGAAFGPLYRLERASAVAGHGLWIVADRGGLDGVAAGASLTVARPDLGWVAASLRHRPGLGSLATATFGLPMGPRWQAGAWLAASETALAGAAELRWQWSSRWWTAAEVARGYGLASDMMAADPMLPTRAGSYAALWAGARID